MKTMNELESMSEEELAAYEKETWRNWKLVTALIDYRKYQAEEYALFNAQRKHKAEEEE